MDSEWNDSHIVLIFAVLVVGNILLWLLLLSFVLLVNFAKLLYIQNW